MRHIERQSVLARAGVDPPGAARRGADQGLHRRRGPLDQAPLALRG